MIAIIDYGVGNLFSLKCSLESQGIESVMTRDRETILNADKIILPGVGAFKDAAKNLRESGLDKVVIGAAESGKPLMEYALECSFYLKKAMNTENMRG